jgi:hypothetical protein
MLALDHQSAEKLRALLVRGTRRDRHDIWLLLRPGLEPGLTLVERKPPLYQWEWKRETLQEAIEDLRAEWKRSFLQSLPRFVPYEVAREHVEALLE